MELHQSELQRIVVVAGPADIQVNVVESVNGADHFSSSEAGSALHADAIHLALRVVTRHELGWVNDLITTTSASAHVDVGNRADSQPFAQRTKIAVRQRARDRPVTNSEDRRSVVDTDVDARVKALGTVAARFANGARNFMWPLERIDRP